MPLNDPHDFFNEREWEVKKNFILKLSFNLFILTQSGIWVLFKNFSDKEHLNKSVERE